MGATKTLNAMSKPTCKTSTVAPGYEVQQRAHTSTLPLTPNHPGHQPLHTTTQPAPDSRTPQPQPSATPSRTNPSSRRPCPTSGIPSSRTSTLTNTAPPSTTCNPPHYSHQASLRKTTKHSSSQIASATTTRACDLCSSAASSPQSRESSLRMNGRVFHH